MLINIEEIIEDKYDELSKSHKKIADFVLRNIKLIPLLSINEFANKTETSISTITRFSQTLGYSGYQDFQNALKELLSKEIVSFKELKSFRDKTSLEHDSLLKKIVDSNKKALDDLLNSKIEDQIKRVTNMLIESENIYIMASRSSFTAAYYFYFIMRGITPKVNLVVDLNGSLTVSLQHVRKADSLVVISYPKYTKGSYEVVKYFASKEANIISITDSMASPFSRFSKETIVANNGDESYSFVGTMSILNAIIVSYNIEESQHSTFEKQDEISDLFDIYL